MKNIYFDYAATTPIDKEVAKKIIPFMEEKFGNPSSLHSFGQDALFAVDNARKVVADFLGSKETEIFFTSSATEANNIAILGILKEKKGAHMITSVFEHKAVLEPAKKSGAEVTLLPVYKEGIVRVEDVKNAIKENTVLISVGYANSEIGTVQPIKEIGDLIKEENKKRKNKIIFHTDAVQAINYLPTNVNDLGVDMLTLSGHKIYGPKGVAVLYIKEGIKISPIIYGASQEKGIKPGTENIFAIAGLGFAIEEVKKNDNKKIKNYRDKIIDTILKDIPRTTLNGNREKRLPNNINISFDGVEGESLMIALDMEGIAVSTGSACASKSLAPSYVLMAIGSSHERAHSSLRISLGRYTTEKEIDYFLEKLPIIVEKLRKISGK
jgi:cysteine desulfurase